MTSTIQAKGDRKNTKLVMETLIHILIKDEPLVMHANLVGRAL
jgi:hypothetical protein